MNFRAERRQRNLPTLEMTPLVDVVFLLLVFFLVTATFAQRDRASIPINLPEGESGTATGGQERVSLLVTSEGEVTVRQEDGSTREMSMDELREFLTELHETDPDSPLYLRGDRSASYGTVMEVLDVLNKLGFRRVYNVIYQSPEPQ